MSKENAAFVLTLILVLEDKVKARHFLMNLWIMAPPYLV